jgi:hypothetical protein
MLRFLRIASALGFLLSAVAFVACIAAPEALERRARAYVVTRIRAEAVARYPALQELARFEGLAESLRARIARGTHLLEARAPDLIATWLSALCRHDCPEPSDTAAALREALQAGIRRLGLGLERVEEWAQGRYFGLVAAILRDLAIVTGTNALMFLLAFLAAWRAQAAPRVLALIAGALILAATAATALYLFAQDWLQTLLFADYVGTAYLAWVALIVAAELDLLLNRARVARALLGGVLGAAAETADAA